ncbi:hypothetical protein [Paenibacillus glycanilyticus]|uniref:AraC family transcriptional regulator n=1 Tax=Paenibacillus glycanilyticus TaxID=126569 RepID=A0ABQ6GEX9_9BACL|nr:hypothetical protein [Paenibacillus glycanilyticus]GLX67597.1 hypothetical protein MU1_19420 [Paenibacillus glycanilyticus]
MRETGRWEQTIFQRAVTHFYALRYSLWIQELPHDQPYDIHHQYLWDIRMHEPVYQAFSEILGTTALWAQLIPEEPAPVKGIICLQHSVPIPLEQCRLNYAQIGDLVLYNPEVHSLDLDSVPDHSWLPIAFFPAQPDQPCLLKERLRSWEARTSHTFLSARGHKLLGSERW